MPGVAVHVVDVVRGLPAIGLQVELRALAEAGTLVGKGAVGTDGQVAHPMVQGQDIALGEHEVLLHLADFYRARGDLPAGEPALIERASIRFVVTDLAEHTHLPFKVSPWGLSVWRRR